MRTCKLCKSERAEIYLPYARLALCKGCFNTFYIRRVKRTIEKYKMFKEGESIGLAVSGGKDSVALADSLVKAFPNNEFIIFHIDLGIGEYSKKSKDIVFNLSKKLDIDLVIYDLKDLEGFTIPDFKRTMYSNKMCSVCGTLKRYIMNVMALKTGVNVLATGHNLDDLVGTMYSMFLAGDFQQLAKLKPVIEGKHPLLVKKIKPLFKTPEAENLYYVINNGLPFVEISCPLARGYRGAKIKKLIEDMSKENPNIKYQLLSSFLKLIKMIEDKIEHEPLRSCKICGGPSSSEVCARCKRIMTLNIKPATPILNMLTSTS